MMKCFPVFFTALFFWASSAFSFQDSLIVAVVPFQTLGEFEHPEIYSHGFAEGLSSDIATVNGITVVERIKLSDILSELSLHQAGLTEDSGPMESFRLLGVTTIISGTVQKSGNIVRILVRGLDAGTGIIRFSLKQDGIVDEFMQLLKIQDEVSEKLIAALGFTVTAEISDKINQPPTRSEEAFRLYSEGLKAFDSGNKQKGLERINAALSADPGFKWTDIVRARAAEAFDELEKVVRD